MLPGMSYCTSRVLRFQSNQPFFHFRSGTRGDELERGLDELSQSESALRRSCSPKLVCASGRTVTTLDASWPLKALSILRGETIGGSWGCESVSSSSSSPYLRTSSPFLALTARTCRDHAQRIHMRWFWSESAGTTTGETREAREGRVSGWNGVGGGDAPRESRAFERASFERAQLPAESRRRSIRPANLVQSSLAGRMPARLDSFSTMLAACSRTSAWKALPSASSVTTRYIERASELRAGPACWSICGS